MGNIATEFGITEFGINGKSAGFFCSVVPLRGFGLRILEV
jgi:hypothetical protein